MPRVGFSFLQGYAVRQHRRGEVFQYPVMDTYFLPGVRLFLFLHGQVVNDHRFAAAVAGIDDEQGLAHPLNDDVVPFS